MKSQQQFSYSTQPVTSISLSNHSTAIEAMHHALVGHEQPYYAGPSPSTWTRLGGGNGSRWQRRYYFYQRGHTLHIIEEGSYSATEEVSHISVELAGHYETAALTQWLADVGIKIDEYAMMPTHLEWPPREVPTALLNKVENTKNKREARPS